MLVGDAHRAFSSRHPLEARVQLDLCRGHPENLALGQFFSDSVNKLGISCHRISDSEPVPSEPHGLFRWNSSFSPVIGWLHVACLGLRNYEKTTDVAVKMDWLLTASRNHQLWFLRGMADSDGTVAVRNKEVYIYTAPNSVLVGKLLGSLRASSKVGHSKGIDYVRISAPQALKLCIFNPDVETHRGKLLRQLVSARTYPYHWPSWLETRVRSLLLSELGVSAIRDKLLFEDSIYVKLKTLKAKRERILGKQHGTE